jgi:hypothetical protein
MPHQTPELAGALAESRIAKRCFDHPAMAFGLERKADSSSNASHYFQPTMPAKHASRLWRCPRSAKDDAATEFSPSATYDLCDLPTLLDEYGKWLAVF